VSGNNVTLSADASGQAFTFKGTVTIGKAANSVMGGTWMSTTGGCGTSQTGQWTAHSVQPLTGSFQGSFHSAGNAQTMNVDFPITGSLTQGNNIGASSATLTGTISAAGYPCLDNAALNGQISGDTVILNIIGPDGLNNGIIGNPNPAQGGAQFDGSNNIVHGSYTVDTKICSAAVANSDTGNVCLGLGTGTGCTEPISLSPTALTFPPQIVGGPPLTQTITLTNQTGSSLSGLNLTFFGPSSDFNGQTILSESDNCGGSDFSLATQQSCTIAVTFNPLQSCPWDPTLSSPPILPAQCPVSQTASLNVLGVTPVSWDSVSTFAAQVGATAESAVVPSTPELDFGWQDIGAPGLPQSVTFMNQGQSPVTILSAAGLPCVYPYQYPPTHGTTSGVQVVYLEGLGGVPPFGACDKDSTTQKPNFPITADGCSGQLLMPQDSCTVSIAFSPQALSEPFSTSSDFYFLELNTQGELDSGRFPVELKTTQPSVLRMSPAAGFNFGNQAVGTTSTPQTVTLSNSSNTAAVTFPTAFFTNNSDYVQTNNCGTDLPAGASCTMSITFMPSRKGHDAGTITITTDTTSGSQQLVFLHGNGQ
jgi:hypothetical protein